MSWRREQASLGRARLPPPQQPPPQRLGARLRAQPLIAQHQLAGGARGEHALGVGVAPAP